MTDRTTPPPGYTVMVANYTGPKLWAPGIEELGQIGPNNTAREGAIAACWKHYDEFTAPARVALLRELAAELEWIDDGICCKYIRDRADALEGKP